MINSIEEIESRDVRKDIYGMFIIHQESCEIDDVFDFTNELDFKCPCQKIVKFLKKLNFHMQYKTLNLKQKPDDQGHNDDRTHMLEKDNNKNNEIKKENSKNNINSTIMQSSKKIEEVKKENHEIESHEENSENKSMMVNKNINF